MRGVLGILIVAVLSSAAVGARAQSTSPVSFAFVLLGEGSDGRPVPMARAVVEGATTCPVLQRASGARQAMTPRERPPGGGFDAVLVCESPYPTGEAAGVIVADRRIDLPVVSVGTPRRIVLLGDSGCRGQAERKPQSCVGDGYDRMWPFGAISVDGARDRPDLIIHVGDYNYRGTPRSMVLPRSATGYAQDLRVNVFDTGDLDDEDDEPRIPIGPAYWSQNMQGSPIPDNWANWRDDFFIPSSRLLVAAPWILNRGNHELCSRAGPGWFYLLDAASPLLGPGRRQNACPPQTPAGWQPGAWPNSPMPFAGQRFPTEPKPPMRLRLGGLNIIAFDSSDAGDAVLYALDHYVAQYRSVAAMLAEDTTPTWIVTHRPIWGVVKKDKGVSARDAPYGFINITQQVALTTVFPNDLPPHVTAVIAGHMHRFQAIGFGSRHPPQLAVGTGGMELSNVQPVPSPDDPKRPIRVPDFAGAVGYVVGLSDFGAMVMSLGERGAWTSALFGTTGETLATCDSTWPGQGSGRSVCELK
ncbi:MAG: hypothetical protein QOE02_2251 [Rhodospirillaceae bacterium]|nr:hypothetical protein [Rhodospirillaceae bacterium]